MKGCFYLAATAAWLAALCASGAYADAVAVVSGEVFLRAGPAPTYPALLPLPVGAKLITHGCNAAYSWCDVSWGAHRGWVSSPYIRFDAHGSKVAVTADYAVSVNVGIVDFDYGYWQAYYVGMPWFGLWGSYYPGGPAPAGGPGGPHGGAPAAPPGGGYGNPHGAGPGMPQTPDAGSPQPSAPVGGAGSPHGGAPVASQGGGYGNPHGAGPGMPQTPDAGSPQPSAYTHPNPAAGGHMHSALRESGIHDGAFMHGGFHFRR